MIFIVVVGLKWIFKFAGKSTCPLKYRSERLSFVCWNRIRASVTNVINELLSDQISNEKFVSNWVCRIETGRKTEKNVKNEWEKERQRGKEREEEKEIKKRERKRERVNGEFGLTNWTDGGVYTVLQSTGGSVQHATAEFATTEPIGSSAGTRSPDRTHRIYRTWDDQDFIAETHLESGGTCGAPLHPAR